MANQTIPITLTPGPVPPGFQAVGIDALIAAVCKYAAGAIRADVSFIPKVATDPATEESVFIFNTTQNVFKVWNTSSGRYVPIWSSALGDVKNSFVGVDTLATGWVVLNGRAISSITGITAAQQSVLTTFFPSGTLPTVSPQNISGLPAGNAFGVLPWPNINPAAGVISPGITFTDPVAGAEGQTLADDTEILRETTDNVFELVKQIQAVSQSVLNALNNNSTPPLYALFFCGF